MKSIQVLHTELKRIGTEENALKMSQYMKGHFPFYGVKSPERNSILKAWKGDYYSTLSLEEKWNVIEELYASEERENQYIAIDLMNKISAKQLVEKDLIKIKKFLITKSWWDSVDGIASNILGVYFKTFPHQIEKTVNEWSNSGNIWLMRSCLLFQLKYGSKTDFTLLTSLIRKFQSNSEFFIQKAIGWTLRQYSKTNPNEVKGFMETIELSPLATREGSKYL